MNSGVLNSVVADEKEATFKRTLVEELIESVREAIPPYGIRAVINGVELIVVNRASRPMRFGPIELLSCPKYRPVRVVLNDRMLKRCDFHESWWSPHRLVSFLPLMITLDPQERLMVRIVADTYEEGYFQITGFWIDNHFKDLAGSEVKQFGSRPY